MDTGRADRAAARALLARRDEFRLIVLDAPAGHGRSEVIWRAVHEPRPHLVDVTVPVADAPDGPGAMRDALHLALGRERSATAPPDAVGATVDVLSAAIRDEGPLCLIVDDAHRAGDDALAYLGMLARALPPHAHLVVGGVGLDALGVGDLLADRSAVRIDTTDLVELDDEDDRVVASLLLDAARLDVTAPTRDLLAILLALDLSRLDVAEAIASDLDPETPVTRLDRLPRLRLVADRVHIDDAWRTIELPVDEHVLRAAAAVAARRLLVTGDVEEAGSLAVAAHDAELLRTAVRAALATQPHRAGIDTLRRWNDARLLDAGDPHGGWLAVACRTDRSEPLDAVLSRYVAVATAFADLGDTEAETSVGLSVGILARRTNDLATLGSLVARSREIAAAGDPRAIAIGLLGDALVRQLSGDPDGAVKVLESVPAGALERDWAAQLSMLWGTNLMLGGHLAEAEVHLEEAVGSGSPWSYATALRLLALVHWLSGRRSVALDDLETAADQARNFGAAGMADEYLAVQAAMAALMGHPDAPTLRIRLSAGAQLDAGARVALDVARACTAVAEGDLEAATAIAADLPLPAQASPPAHWVVGLVAALAPDRGDELRAAVDPHPSLRLAWEAGVAARTAVAGGPRAGIEHRAYIPACWCVDEHPEIRIDVLGQAAVLRNGRPVEHPYWERPRVRELCLYLAMSTPGSRALAGERLWPDLSGIAAARNLRVTLANLLDVLDPDRRRGTGSRLVDERNGLISLVVDDGLIIDLRETQRDATALLEMSRAGDSSAAMAAARRLVRRRDGPLLGGVAIGEWADAPERERRELLLRAVSIGAPQALALGDPDLAEGLVRRGLALDPWAERLHQMVVRCHLQRDDLDGARRSLRECMRALDDLGVRPERATIRLAHEMGVTI